MIQNSDGFSPIPNGTAKAARKVPGVELVATIRSAQAKLLGSGAGARRLGADPRHRRGGEGRMEEGRPGGSAQPHRRPGDPLRLLRLRHTASKSATASACSARRRKRPSFEVVGEFSSKLGVFGSVLITQRVLAREFGQTQDTIDFVETAPGADAAKVQAMLTQGVEVAFPTAEVLNQQELKESREEQVDQLVNLIFALLGLAILISLFGIANTLALSIHERTRELGMLRAIGMSRRQVRTMIRYEAVITALIGAILGMVLGIVFAALIAQPLKDEGFTLSYPVGSLIVLLVLAALLGVLAAIFPARRASRLDVLESLQYE